GAVVEVQVCVDDDVNGGEVEVLLAQWMEAGVEGGHRWVQLRHAGVDQRARIGMIDEVHGDRHSLALGEQVGNAEWRDGDWSGGGHFSCFNRSTVHDCPTLAPRVTRSSSSWSNVSPIASAAPVPAASSASFEG